MKTSRQALDAALALLPHGAEFRFLDQLMELCPGESGTGMYTLKGDEVFLRGHFPGEPVFPGVLLLEAGAQLAGVVAQTSKEQEPLPNLRLTAIRAAKILGAASPGDTIALRASITGRFSALVQAHVEATLKDRPIMTADIVLSGTDK